MMQIRRSEERGHFQFGWLDTKHTFSFGEYFDPKFMGFRSLRVINEDFIAPATGFPEHGHKDMEIISYIAQGSLAHRDTLGNVKTINPGEVQRMTAGSGIRHSEFNPSQSETTQLLQIWILPNGKNLTPGYEQTSFEQELKKGGVVLVASQKGQNGSVSLNQDVKIYALKSDKPAKHQFEIQKSRGFWIQVINGTLNIMNEKLGPGDAAAIENESVIQIETSANSEVLFFDLA